ncbi:MAG TPA: Mur ligase family protein [Sphingomonas sp.]|jgi:UDP-N-acetylmuramate--alanine ligase|nr:Mur ligase family protein [Sphingomonas sp.]
MASYFFVGLGGSGMLPLAEIVKAGGAEVSGSDRAYDQGRTPEKFDALRAAGFSLHPQDGSGVRPGQIIVASAAIEETVPDIARAKELGLERLTRAELLARLLNAAPVSVAVGGTSGKSTVTGMTGWILAEAGLNPTIVNGAVMRNFGSASRTGGGGVMLSEVDESDGSIALYRPTVGIVTNIALDHKPLPELRNLFGNFVTASQHPVVNADDAESASLPGLRFGFFEGADVRGSALEESPNGISFDVNHRGSAARITLAVPGKHNAANALAAIAAAVSLDIPLAQAAAALSTYRGIARRLEVVGEADGVTVIDDFGHNPDKIAATIATLGAFPGRLLLFFQPHGYGPLKLMARELGESFASNMRPGDHLIVSDPAYFGGTTDKSVGSGALIAHVPGAEHIASRDDCSVRLLELAQPGDRIVVMGARDDSLTSFARGLLDTLAARNS